MTDLERAREIVDNWLNGSQKSPELIDLIASAMHTARDEGRRQELEKASMMDRLEAIAKHALYDAVNDAESRERAAKRKKLKRTK